MSDAPARLAPKHDAVDPDAAQGAQTVQTAQYGTARGERKAWRKAAALAREAARAAAPPRAARPLPVQGAAAEAAAWDAAYAGAGRAYRDRHVLRAAFPELMPAAVRAAPRAHVAPLGAEAAEAPAAPDQVLLEVGVGLGSALWPVLRANARLFGLGFDSSAGAVARARSHPECVPGRARVFRADAADWDALHPHLPAGGVHFALAAWALSALGARALADAARNVARALRPGGLLCVRDFAAGDMREGRFREREALVEQAPAGDVFRRGDGTLAAFFTEKGLCAVLREAGLERVRVEVVEREVRNRKTGVVMHRRWIHAVFRRPAEPG